MTSILDIFQSVMLRVCFLLVPGMLFIFGAREHLHLRFIGFGFIAILIWLCLRDIQRYLRGGRPDMHSEDPYTVLGVRRNADAATIERAYQRLMDLHRVEDGTSARCNAARKVLDRIHQAYVLLSNEERRFQYDSWVQGTRTLPPLVEAYDRFRDADKHEIYEAYDESEKEAEEDDLDAPA
jgi:hypothetical protein